MKVVIRLDKNEIKIRVNKLHPKMQEYIEEISRLNLKNRTVSLIVNSSWAPEHSNKIKEKLEK